MSDYNWEIAEELEEGMRNDEVSKVSSVLTDLEDKNRFTEEDSKILYLAREYAEEKDHEEISERANEILERRRIGLKEKFAVAGASFMSANTFYDIALGQNLNPLEYAPKEFVASTILATIALEGLDRYFERELEYSEDLSVEDYSEIPELEGAAENFYD